MKRYATAYISFFDNALHMHIVEAENKLDAIRKVLALNNDGDIGKGDTVEEIQQFAFDCDSMVNAIELE